MSNDPVNTLPSDATLIDFDNAIGTYEYAEDGFLFTTNSSPFSRSSDLDMVGTHSWDSQVYVRAMDGNSFDASSIQVANIDGASTPRMLEFIGTLADGGIVSQSYTTTGSFEKELVTLEGFTDLTDLRFTTDFASFDDLVLMAPLKTKDDTETPIEGISVNDADGDLERTELSVMFGTIKVDLSGGATILNGENNSRGFALGGTQNEINAALSTLTYRSDPNFLGTDKLAIFSTDSTGVPATNTDELFIDVSYLTERAPANTLPTSTLIDFDNAIGTDMYAEDGFLVQAGGRDFIRPFELDMVAVGSTFSRVHVKAMDNNRFDASSIVISEIDEAAGPQTIEFIGRLADGGTVSQFYTTSGAFEKERVTLDGFTEIRELEFVADSIAFDDLVLSSPLKVKNDTEVAIEGISVRDLDGNLARTHLSVQFGTIGVKLSGGATIMYGENNSRDFALEGTQAEINAALSTLTYRSDPGFLGTERLTVFSEDSSESRFIDTDERFIDVSYLTETAPVNTLPSTATLIDFSNAIGTNVYAENGFLFETNWNGFVRASAFNMVSTDSTYSNVRVSAMDGSSFDAASIFVSELDAYSWPRTMEFRGIRANGDIVSQTYTTTENNTAPGNYTTPENFEKELVTLNGFTDLRELEFTTDSTAFDDLVLVAPLKVKENAEAVIEGISVSDIDGDLERTELSVQHGTLGVDLSGGATIIDGENNSRGFALGGSQSEINAALATLTYRSDLGFEGTERLIIASTDSSGLQLTDTDELLIDVSRFVDTAPVNTLPSNPTLISFSGASDGYIYEESGFYFETRWGSFSESPAFNMVSNTQPYEPSVVYVEAIDGSSFDAASIYVSEDYEDVDSQTLTFTGMFADGSRITQSYTTSRAFEKELVVLDGFTNLSSLEFTSRYTSFDDLVLFKPLTVEEDTELLLEGIGVSDADGDLEGTEIWVENGTLSVDLVGDTFLYHGENNTSSMVLGGSQDAINETLATLTYQGNPEFSGTDTLTIISSSYNGSAPPLIDTDQVLIKVVAVNDAPEIYDYQTFEIAEDSLNGTVIGLAYAEDAEYDNLQAWEIIGGSGQSVFSIDAATGAIALTNETLLDYETQQEYRLDLIVSDGEDTSAVRSVNINVTDVPEAPNFNTIEGTASNDILKGKGQADLIIGREGNDVLRGNFGDDYLEGSEGNDRFFGGQGADVIDGGEGKDMASYASSSEGVSITLEDGFAVGSGGEAQGDRLISIERLTGSNFDDTLIGDEHNNMLIGLSGNDFIDGAGGVDAVNYSRAAGGVVVDLANGFAFDSQGSNDTLVSIEKVLGSQFDDGLYGNDARNILIGFEGDDTIDGRKGNDVLDGRGGADTMTGGIGSDTFRITELTDSQLTGFDVITDLYIGKDRLDTQNALSAEEISQLGEVSDLTEFDLQALLTETAFAADEAATFTLGQRTFLAINDSQDGYLASQDGLIEITGFRGDLAALTTV